MRSNSVDERFCTGDAEPFEVHAWAATVPHTAQSALSLDALELKRYFDIDELLDESSAARIWKKPNSPQTGTYSAGHPEEIQGLDSLRRMTRRMI
jgi:glucuronate isomerase